MQSMQSQNTWNIAVENAEHDVITRMHQDREEGCTTDVMDLAAKIGHLDIVE